MVTVPWSRAGARPNVMVATAPSAPPARVWQALTDPGEVSRWDGVEPLAVPSGYPSPGQHARWRTRFGPVRLVLHDRVRTVDPGRRLVSTIDVGFVHIEEEYRLTAAGGGTVVVSENQVTARIPGIRWLARWVTRRSVGASMQRLDAFCASQE